MRTSAIIRGVICLGIATFVSGCAQTPLGVPETPLSATIATPSPTPQAAARPTPTPTTRTSPERPLLMAHYMPWYQTPAMSGVWGWHWTMEHFNPEITDGAGRQQIASHTMPVTGPYDSSDPAILEYQVMLMTISGIDGVIVDWYGIEAFWDYGDIHRATQKLFEIIDSAGLRFAICYEDQTVKHMVDNQHLPVSEVYDHGREVLNYLEATWFNEEAYLTFAGRPVLLTFGPQYFRNAADWDRLTAELEKPLALVTLDKHTESAGVGSFPWPPMHASRNGLLSQETLVGYLEGFYQKAERMDYRVAGAFPGFHDIYAEAEVGSSYGYLDPQDGETFELTLEMALAQDPDVIQLITWNDYGEGTAIEPTKEFGTRYLERVQRLRRETDHEAFPFAAEDLTLPLRLLEARRQYQGDEAANTQLDQVFEAIVAREPEKAAVILTEFTRTP